MKVAETVFGAWTDIRLTESGIKQLHRDLLRQHTAGKTSSSTRATKDSTGSRTALSAFLMTSGKQ